MTGRRLNGLAHMHVHKDVEIDIDETINVFTKSLRRLDFIYNLVIIIIRFIFIN